jgi:hypothetical protein
MKKYILMVITLTILSNVALSDPGFNYKKHNRKAKMHRFMSRVFNTNGCKGYKYH